MTFSELGRGGEERRRIHNHKSLSLHFQCSFFCEHLFMILFGKTLFSFKMYAFLLCLFSELALFCYFSSSF